MACLLAAIHSGAYFAYRPVVAAASPFVWPSSADTSHPETPRRLNSVATVCRSTLGTNHPGSPASATIARHAVLTDSTG